MDKYDEKRMELLSISKVIKKGAEYHIKSDSIKNIDCCLVVFGEERRLVLEAKDEIEMDYFLYEL